MIRCLICESKAILTRDVAKGIALLVSLADSALQGGSGCEHRHTHAGEPLAYQWAGRPRTRSSPGIMRG